MIWLTWRQHRIQIIVLSLVLALVCLVLLMTGIHIAEVARTSGLFTCNIRHVDCLPAQSAVVGYTTQISFGNVSFYYIFHNLLMCLPALIGMFVGVPLVAQEFVHGTYRMAWAQSIQWSRWLLIKSSLLAFVIACGGGVLYAVFIWWKAPYLTALGGPWGDYLNNDVWGFVAIAYMVFAFMLGIAVGSVVKKTIPAMVITVILFIIIRVSIEVFLRPSLVPPHVYRTPYPRAYAYSQILPEGGSLLSHDITLHGQSYNTPGGVCSKLSGIVDQEARTAPIHHGENEAPFKESSNEAALQKCLVDHGFQDEIKYFTGDQYVQLQAAESGVFIILAALSLGIAFWSVRRSLT